MGDDATIRRACFALAAAGVVGCASVEQPPRAAHLSAALGRRALRADGWQPVADQDVFALDLDWRPDGWPVWLVAALAAGGATEDRSGEYLQSALAELDLGLRYYLVPGAGRVQPYLGGGAAWIYGRNEEPIAAPGATTETERDDSLAGWLEIGVSLPQGGWHWGLAARALFSSERDVRGPSDMDYEQLVAFAGMCW